MEIRKATKKDIKESIKIAKDLKEWFTNEAVKNMRIDFSVNNLVVVAEKKKVLGFLCWNSENGIIKIVWLAVKKEYMGKNIGSKLLNWLEKKAKNMGAIALDVETLTDKDSYEPYKLTRDFYYKNGFKRIAYKKARIKGWDDQIMMEKKLK